MLWTYRDDSFLPHNLYGEGPDPAPPIQIGVNATPEQHRDILINLSQQIPTCHTQFARIIEIIVHDEKAKETGRERYRFYRAQGFEVKTHQLQNLDCHSREGGNPDCHSREGGNPLQIG
jgi:DNA polymerase-3 subunit chi